MEKKAKYLVGAFVILIPADAYANTGVPMIFLTMPAMLAGLIPIIGIESYILAKRLDLSRRKLLVSSTIANVASTLIGVPLTWAMLVILQSATGGGGVPSASPVLRKFLAVTWQAPWLLPYESDLHWMVPTAMLVLLVPFFFVSWKVESAIIWRLNKSTGKRVIGSACRRANVASYAFLAVLCLLWYFLRLPWFFPFGEFFLDALVELIRTMDSFI